MTLISKLKSAAKESAANWKIMKQNLQTNGLALAGLIIALSLAAGIIIAMSPPEVETLVLALVSVLVLAVASIKFAALSLFAFRRKKRKLGGLWALLSLQFLMLLMASVQYLIDLRK